MGARGPKTKPREHRVCAHCNATFACRAASTQKACSRSCAQFLLPRPVRGGVKHRDQVCAYCAASFRKPFACKFCSLSCSGKAQGKKPSEITCQQCGATAPRKTGSGTERIKFCSRECAFSAKSELKSQTIARRLAQSAQKAVDAAERRAKAVVQCLKCGHGFIKPKGSRGFCSRACGKGQPYRRVKPLVSSNCGECGQQVVSVRARARCDRCAKRAMRRARGSERHEARARRYGVQRCYSITAQKLFDRDGWKCQICGDRTHQRLQGKQQPKSPTIDHIVPLSRGGGHLWENVQTACHACNMAKGATTLGQLRLVG